MTKTDTPKNIRIFAAAAISMNPGKVGYSMALVRGDSKAHAVENFLIAARKSMPGDSFRNADAVEISNETLKALGACFDGFAELAVPNPVIPAEIMSPDWSGGGKVHNWRTYISPEVRKIWDTFTPEQKKVLHQAAEDTAGKEDWA